MLTCEKDLKPFFEDPKSFFVVLDGFSMHTILSSPYYSKPQQETQSPVGLGIGMFKFEYHCESGPFF